MMTKGEHTNVRTYSHTYVRDRPYIPSTTLLCQGIKKPYIPKIIMMKLSYGAETMDKTDVRKAAPLLPI